LPPTGPPVAGGRSPAGWSIGIALAPGVLRKGIDPLNLLGDLRLLGAGVITPLVGNVPDHPQALHLEWRVELVGDCSADAIEEVFKFVRDDMELILTARRCPKARESRPVVFPKFRTSRRKPPRRPIPARMSRRNRCFCYRVPPVDEMDRPPSTAPAQERSRI
jgi:hypothetical protein